MLFLICIFICLGKSAAELKGLPSPDYLAVLDSVRTAIYFLQCDARYAIRILTTIGVTPTRRRIPTDVLYYKVFQPVKKDKVPYTVYIKVLNMLDSMLLQMKHDIDYLMYILNFNNPFLHLN